MTTNRNRLQSLDQFRGWVIFAMIAVNVLGHFTSMPETLRHHRLGMSLADVIAPLFLFIAGMSFRISFMSRLRDNGIAFTQRRAARRYLLLIFLGALFYLPYTDSGSWESVFSFYLRDGLWNALVNIGFVGLIALPLIHESPMIRICAAVCSLIFFQSVCDMTTYGRWLSEKSNNGGPIGALSWAFPFLMGSIAMDWLKEKRLYAIGMYVCSGAVLLGIGFTLSYWWPFSKYGMTCSFAVMTSGIGFLVLPVFCYSADLLQFQLPHLSMLGRNALVAYLIQETIRAISFLVPIFSPHAGVAMAIFSLTAIYFVCYGATYYCDRKGYTIPL